MIPQTYDLFSDTVSVICASLTCTGKTYTLVYTATLATVPADLAIVSSGADPRVKLKTLNYLYTGLHNVKIKCSITKTDGTVIYGFGPSFDLNVIACDE
jgi:hypothetical protein